MHQSIEERMFVSQQGLWCVKLDHSPSIHDKNTVTIHDGIEPKTREIALINHWKIKKACLSTGSQAFSLLMCLDTTKYVLLRVVRLIETICAKIWAKPLPCNAKSPLQVDVCLSKTSLYNKKMREASSYKGTLLNCNSLLAPLSIILLTGHNCLRR